MSKKTKHTGFAIALAWPQTYCKQPGAWYDIFNSWLGISTNFYYKVGHAALILINSETKCCHYFDFGRYHAPYQYGRVRSAETDHELKITIKASIDNESTLLNFTDILKSVQDNQACHGDGILHASFCAIDFSKALDGVKQMQDQGSIPYGPFKPNGSNCSRFVNKGIRFGKPDLKYWLKLNFLVPLTPTPINNVNALSHKKILKPHCNVGNSNLPLLPKDYLKSTLPQPKRHSNIPIDAQWLSGEGAGSWFELSFNNEVLKINRYSPKGYLECYGYYKSKESITLLPNQKYDITHPSHCKEITLRIDGKLIRFSKI